MGDFGADTLKPSWIYCNCRQAIAQLLDHRVRKFNTFLHCRNKRVTVVRRRANGNKIKNKELTIKKKQNKPNPNYNIINSKTKY